MISVEFYGLGEHASEFIVEIPVITHEALEAAFLPTIKLPDLAKITFGFSSFGQPGTIIMNGVKPIGAFLFAGVIDNTNVSDHPYSSMKGSSA